jgi:hypothetical protein
MISRKSMGPLLGVCYVAVYGALILGGLDWHQMSRGTLLLLSSAVFVALYFAGRWIAVRSELNKKLPTSSKELRRRTKAFYDWLGSQGRPQSRR